MTALRAGRADFDSRDQGPLWLRIDSSIVLLTLALLSLGILVVYSATRGVVVEGDTADRAFLDRQVLFAIVGVAAAVVATAFDYRRTKSLVPVLYAGSVVLLIGLFAFGSEFNNATSWYSFGFVTLQPSEFTKIALIMALAAWFSHTTSGSGLRFLDVFVGLVMTGVVGALVLLQPDYGTVMVYGAIIGGIVLVAGVRPWHVGAVFALLAALVSLAFSTGQIQAYQIERFTAFASSDAPERYNVDQSEIAIGNGGLTGTGLFQGSQNNNSLVPEKETDFIFSVVGEELGFVGAAAVLVAYGLLLMRVWRVAHLAENDYGRLICVGVFSMLMFQAFQSIGMNMGMMPVTGIPLPLISYGGSSLVTSLIAIGLVENVHAHRLR